MKKLLAGFLFSMVWVVALAQAPNPNNTLLWKISGKNLSKPSYLFGTIHILCADNIELSTNLRNAIGASDRVYLELDMDNMFEMLGVLGKMKMRNDTTLADLLTVEEYDKVKTFFKSQPGLIPFSVLETYKPMLAASTLMQASLDCKKQVAMEQLVMKEAKSKRKDVKGLETMAYQMSIFDSIPYGVQARQLFQYIDNYEKNSDNKEFEELTSAYLSQQLDKLEAITKKEDVGIANFTEILLYRRNEAWAKKLEELMATQSLVVAVGAGHLPGDRGVINLLRRLGYTVEPQENDMVKKPPTREM
ncbi:MAG: TraB/GumN family protein [Chitinophagaceae bacterium]